MMDTSSSTIQILESPIDTSRETVFDSELKINPNNSRYYLFEAIDKTYTCSIDALDTYHRVSDAMLERDPELHDLWIDSYFYSYAFIEVFENEMNYYYHSFLRNNVKSLNMFRRIEGWNYILNSYMKYFEYIHDDNSYRIYSLINLYFSALTTIFLHNRYGLRIIETPKLDVNNNDNKLEESSVQMNKKKSLSRFKTNVALKNYIEKNIPNFNQVLKEAIQTGNNLVKLMNFNKMPTYLEMLNVQFNAWCDWLKRDSILKRKRSDNEQDENYDNKRQRANGDDLISLQIPKQSVLVSTNEIVLTDNNRTPINSLQNIIKLDKNYKGIFSACFEYYVENFYPTQLTTNMNIGGERFVLNKWSKEKLHYFLPYEYQNRLNDHTFEKEIQDLYHQQTSVLFKSKNC
ncbi:unnamed protein product [Didymodactylos carnosus]|uniref:Uncharacterized protein n=1 Tax=Didymodactylos carnosus TaxID=1234261 RepID=A0A814SAZ5_9BILA|nr:unnamed protein product [Didymodactylos carnosus]CAF1145798.1 unnamed protein product [Didymodactylos carnosus]CAF3775848.1 unnamed protein product [Didymodactylos carnosus]CAF3909406.1 unnamed protein product [Didymodactylos carnosus]